MQDWFNGIDPISLNAVIAVATISLLDFVTGALRAIANRTFEWSALDVWVRTQLLGRVVPIVLLIAAGQVVGTLTIGDPESGGVTLSVLGTAGIAGAITVILAGIKSILDNVRPSVEHPVPVE